MPYSKISEGNVGGRGIAKKPSKLSPEVTNSTDESNNLESSKIYEKP